MAASIAPDIDVMPGVLIGPAQGQNTSSSTCLWRVSHGHAVTEYLIPSPSVRSHLLMHSLTRHVMQVVRWDSEAANDSVPVITSADSDDRCMAPIPLQLTGPGDAPAAAVEVDGVQVAAGLGLDVDLFRQLMEDRKVAVLCERGIGADAGRLRATFYFGGRRFRAVIDGHGRILDAHGTDGPAA